jgi:hypothetical protein
MGQAHAEEIDDLLATRADRPGGVLAQRLPRPARRHGVDATALDRPEGTVKAQVHRGLALLRTAFEAAERREREEMTA